MRRRLAALSLLPFVVLFGHVHAQEVNWTYIEGGFGKVDPDRTTSDDGPFIGGAVGLNKIPIHIFGDYGSYSNIDVAQIGAGWHGLLGDRADLFADGAFYDQDFEDGFKVRFGVRWLAVKRVEINGYLAWTDLDFSDNRSAAAGAIFNFTKRFGVGGFFEKGNDFDIARAFVRFNFKPVY